MALPNHRDLSDRQRTILEIVSHEDVETAADVASRTVASRPGVGVSASTIRNDFAVLEEMGYLTHPHTSAGRIPTDRGYRHFVDGILRRRFTVETPSRPLKPESLAT